MSGERKVVKYPSIEHFDINSTRDWGGSDDPLEADNSKYYFEEKVDGSQISFSVTVTGPDKEENEVTIEFFNKGKPIAAENKVFLKTMIMISGIKDKLDAGLVYHGESICERRHNTIQYERLPKFYFVLYDICDKSDGRYFSYEEKHEEAQRLGFDIAPRLYVNEDRNVPPKDKIEELMAKINNKEIPSVLGGNNVEGIVLKHHAFYKKGKKFSTKLKIVCDEFKESNTTKKQKRSKMTAEEVLVDLGSRYAVQARYKKAYQHLRDQMKLKNNSKDLYAIMHELDADFEKEYLEEMKNYLWAEFRTTILENTRKDMKEWYEAFTAEN